MIYYCGLGLHILNHPCTPGMNLTWPLYMIILICLWIWFVISQLLICCYSIFFCFMTFWKISLSIFSLIHWLFRSVFNFHVSEFSSFPPDVDLYLYTIVVRSDDWYDFDPLKLVKIYFCMTAIIWARWSEQCFSITPTAICQQEKYQLRFLPNSACQVLWPYYP